MAANATTEHKVAKLKSGGFVVCSKKDNGWIDGSGKVVEVSSSPKVTTFLTEVDAKAQGFSPTEVQKAALAAWAAPAPKAEEKKAEEKK